MADDTNPRLEFNPQRSFVAARRGGGRFLLSLRFLGLGCRLSALLLGMSLLIRQPMRKMRKEINPESLKSENDGLLFLP